MQKIFCPYQNKFKVSKAGGIGETGAMMQGLRDLAPRSVHPAVGSTGAPRASTKSRRAAREQRQREPAEEPARANSRNDPPGRPPELLIRNILR